MSRPQKLSDDAVRERIEKLDGWKLQDGKLHRKFTFDDFVTAFRFMAAAALVAEKLDHHPEWSNVYKHVTVDLTTHDAGGVTSLDFELAEAMNRLAG